MSNWTCALRRLVLALYLVLFNTMGHAWAAGAPGSYAIIFDAAGEPKSTPSGLSLCAPGTSVEPRLMATRTTRGAIRRI